MNTEYKIVQSTTPHFAKPAQLARVLAEEAQAGWQLVEKFDNFKIRLQREISHREQDSGRSIDPYRCHVGPSNWITYSAAALATAAVVLVILRGVGAI
ncbi:hypothetical protein [Pseudohongiella spirulinae]|uniref:Uncharacterized protein n=1 Tax=Pseudohongiella spirulinae TaxID=1249552 RepID=A0A0S2KA09_9GAMM|nr:hypothetical protein [Pseudohongiella spirulinae]ALO45169.1 hypothetical protein PS2015_483 [Pseudohongiella spirulinae]